MKGRLGGLSRFFAISFAHIVAVHAMAGGEEKCISISVYSTAQKTSQVCVGEAADQQKADAIAKEDLDRALAANPSLEAKVIQLVPSDPGLSKDAKSSWPANVSQEEVRVSRSFFGRIYSKFKTRRVYRPTYSIVRFFTAGGLTAWAYLAFKHVPVEVALSVGTVIGSIGFSFGYWQDDYQRFILRSRLQEILKSAGERVSDLVGLGVSSAKWYATDSVECLLVKLALFLPWGISTEHTIAGAALATLASGAIQFVGEFPIGYAVSKLTARYRPRYGDDVVFWSNTVNTAISIAGSVINAIMYIKVPHYLWISGSTVALGWSAFAGSLLLTRKGLPTPKEDQCAAVFAKSTSR